MTAACATEFPIIYLHIPKTAGTSFRNSAAQYYGPNNVLADYGEQSENTSKEILHGFYHGDSPRLQRDRCTQKRFLTGHFTLERYRDIFPGSPIVSFFRSPMERVVSEYFHFVNHHNFAGSLHDFCLRPRFQNRQSYAMSGAQPADLDFFGITERYQESLIRFNKRYGTNFPLATMNKGCYEEGIEGLATGQEIEEIIDFNQRDHQLYQKALTEFDAQQAYSSVTFPTAGHHCGTLDEVRENKVCGWAFNRESNQPATIRVTVNGRERCTQIADSDREDIRREGLHVAGNCGFEVPLSQVGELRAGDRIGVISEDKSFELSNSPITYRA